MNIAICISGYARDYIHLFNNFRDFVFDTCRKHKVWIFVNTWDTLNSKFCLSANIGETNPHETPLNANQIHLLYSPTELRVEKFDEVKEMFTIENIFGELDLSVFEGRGPVHDGSIYFDGGKHYQAMRCNELKTRFEKKVGWRFDACIKTRFDHFYTKGFNFDEFDSSKLYAQHHLCDRFIVSSSEGADKISSLFLNLESIASSFLKPKFATDAAPWSSEAFWDYQLAESGYPLDKRVIIGTDFCFPWARPLFIARVLRDMSDAGRAIEFWALEKKIALLESKSPHINKPTSNPSVNTALLYPNLK